MPDNLIEKVAKVIDPIAWVNPEDPVFALRRADSRMHARRAIQVVADWIGPEYCVTQGNLMQQLEKAT